MIERLFVFQTTHHALWAEDVAREAGVPAELVPAPSEAKAGCDLALRARPQDLAGLAHLLTNEGVSFAHWPSAD